MPWRKPRPHRRGKLGDDGLTDRERAFAFGLRKDPTASYTSVAKRAGFLGSDDVLGRRARVMMKKAGVLAIIHAPERPEDVDLDEDGLKDELRRRLLIIARGNADAADKIRAIDKLLCTIPGGYVPVQVDMKGKMTLEGIVRAMGGAPDESQGKAVLTLPEPTQEGADA